MGRRLFRFQKFAMTDEHCGMRIGTDAVLLGAWAGTDNGIRRIADIGTGCGIIALMLAQRVPEALVEGVETELGACRDARTNFDACRGENAWCYMNVHLKTLTARTGVMTSW